MAFTTRNLVSAADDEPPEVPNVGRVTFALRILAALSSIGALLWFSTGLYSFGAAEADTAAASFALALAAMTSGALLFATALALDLLNGILWNTGEVAAATPDQPTSNR